MLNILKHNKEEYHTQKYQGFNDLTAFLKLGFYQTLKICYKIKIHIRRGS